MLNTVFELWVQVLGDYDIWLGLRGDCFRKSSLTRGERVLAIARSVGWHLMLRRGAVGTAGVWIVGRGRGCIRDSTRGVARV